MVLEPHRTHVRTRRLSHRRKNTIIATLAKKKKGTSGERKACTNLVCSPRDSRVSHRRNALRDPLYSRAPSPPPPTDDRSWGSRHRNRQGGSSGHPPTTNLTLATGPRLCLCGSREKPGQRRRRHTSRVDLILGAHAADGRQTARHHRTPGAVFVLVRRALRCVRPSSDVLPACQAFFFVHPDHSNNATSGCGCWDWPTSWGVRKLVRKYVHRRKSGVTYYNRWFGAKSHFAMVLII